jgi:hypothetical protein
LAAFIVPACSMGNNQLGNGGGAGATSALWNPTNGAAGTSAPDGAPGALLWNDPNTAPITGGPVSGGNLTYGQADPTDYGAGPPPTAGAPWKDTALSTNAPQNQTTGQDEQSLEGFALAYHASLVNVPVGGGGNLGIGVVNQQPPLYSSQNMELEPRAWCEAFFQPNGQPTAGPGGGAGGLQWRLQECGINNAMQNPSEFFAGVQASAQAAWNAISGGAQARIQAVLGSGYCGAGAWTGAAGEAFDLTIIDLPLGQTP